MIYEDEKLINIAILSSLFNILLHICYTGLHKLTNE